MRRRVHSPSAATSSTVVSVTAVRGSTNASEAAILPSRTWNTKTVGLRTLRPFRSASELCKATACSSFATTS
jgi:hypothetical protein